MLSTVFQKVKSCSFPNKLLNNWFYDSKILNPKEAQNKSSSIPNLWRNNYVAVVTYHHYKDFLKYHHWPHPTSPSGINHHTIFNCSAAILAMDNSTNRIQLHLLKCVFDQSSYNSEPSYTLHTYMYERKG